MIWIGIVFWMGYLSVEKINEGGLFGMVVLIFAWLLLAGGGLNEVFKSKKMGNTSKKIPYLLFLYSIPFLICGGFFVYALFGGV